MQIPSTSDSGTTGPIRQVHSHHVQKGATARPSERSRSHAVDGVEVVGGQADQIQSLVSQLREVPTSRVDVVETVRSRIEQGEYTTRSAAERTAARILGSDAIS